MNILYACPTCNADVRQEFTNETRQFDCPACDTSVKVNDDCLRRGKLCKCLVCPSVDLFVRKNFPQRLGVTIVVVGFALSCVTWFLYKPIATFAILLATALLDVVLYVLVGEVIECYRCQARYGGMDNPSSHEAFDLEVHERYRQQQARLAK